MSPSKVRYSDFFKTFVGIIPYEGSEKGDFVDLIKIEDFNTFYNYLFSQKALYEKKRYENVYSTETLLTFDLILCSVHFLCGNIEECLRILSSPKNDVEYLFKSYIESTQPEFKIKDDLLVRLSSMANSTNPTVKFLMAKVYKEIGNISMYLELMGSMKDEYSFTMADLLKHYISTKDFLEFKNLEREAFDKFGLDDTVIYITWEYYFNTRDKERLELLDVYINTENARKLYMKGRYRGFINDVDLRDKYLNEAIRMDDTYFEIYFYFATLNKLDNLEKYKFYMEKAIKAASCKKELYECYKDLISMEIKDFVRKKLETIIYSTV